MIAVEVMSTLLPIVSTTPFRTSNLHLLISPKALVIVQFPRDNLLPI